MRKPARRKCAHCREWFHPAREGQVVCSFECASAIAKKQTAKAREDAKQKEAQRQRTEDKAGRQRRKARLAELRPNGYYKAQAQKAFNAYIRARDAGLPCISCGETNPPDLHGGQWDCGHFKTVGAYPELRFEEKNAYRQCKACNGGSGRFAAKNATVHARYRETLIEWYGLPLVEWLEGPHEAKHYSKEDLEEIAAKYRRKTRELKKQRAA
ncbi:TPA: NinG family protein [Klebsiella pneumoniae]|nr:NinG family protein [Klebsiella pneumoniae]